MKKIVVVFIFIFSLLCSSAKTVSPDDVITTYLKSLFSGNYSSAYAQLCIADKNIKTVEEWSQVFLNNATIRFAFENTTFKIIKVSIDGKSAIAEVETTNPATSKIIGAISDGNMWDKSEEEIYNYLVSIKNTFTENVSTLGKFNLILENNVWKVFLNLSKQKQEAVKTAISKITISNVEVTLDGGMSNTIIECDVKNLSTETIYQVVVTIYGLDDSDKYIFEKKNIELFNSIEEPLKPNYSSRFFHSFSRLNFPKEWKGNIKIVVTGIAISINDIDLNAKNPFY